MCGAVGVMRILRRRKSLFFLRSLRGERSVSGRPPFEHALRPCM